MRVTVGLVFVVFAFPRLSTSERLGHVILNGNII